MASEQMGMPAAAPSSEEMAVFDQMRQNISPKEFSDEMLAGASQVDPQAVSEFRQELDGLDMPPEVLDALNDLVDEILANPGRYDEIRQNYIGQGIPEDFLPEQFDPQFFAALNMAIDQMIGAPAGPQAFAKGGIAELKPIAKAIAGYGRNGDTMLAHITPAEARMLKRRGGSGTINPKTGLPEFFLGKLFKSVGNALKKVGNAVKKFANSTVGRLVTTVALGFFLGPAAASALGVSSAAGVAAVSGFVGSAGSTLLAGGNLRDALKAGAVGGLTAGAGAGIMGGSEAFTAGSYTGPTTVGGQFERFKSAFSPTPLQQAAAAPIPPAGGTAAPLGVQTTGAAPGTAPVPEVGSAFGPDNIDIGGGQNFGMQGSRATPSMLDQVKDFYKKEISPQGIQQAGMAKAEQAGISAMDAMKARLPNATPAMLENAYQTAYKAAMPGTLATYGPMAAVGIGALGAMGGFEAKPAPDTPESKMMRDRLQREEQMMKDNPGMFTPTGMERFGAVYNDKGQIIKWNPWSPESAGAFDQYRSPLRFPMYAPPPPPPPPGFAKGGLASLAGGGMPGYAEGGDVAPLFREIYGRDPADWELENVKGMSTDQVRNILTESAKNIAPPPPTEPAALPGNASQEALRARNPEMAEFMEWRLGEMDPMFHERIGARAERYNWDPYSFSDDMYNSWQATIDNAKRRAAMGGETPEWMQEGWRERQAARNAAYDAEQERRRQEALNSPFVTGGSAPVVGPSGAPVPTASSQGVRSLSVPQEMLPDFARTSTAVSVPPPQAGATTAPRQGTLQTSTLTPGDPFYSLADAIYQRKKEAWNTEGRVLEDWEIAQLQGKTPEEVAEILRFSIANWRRLHPESGLDDVDITNPPMPSISTPVTPDPPPPMPWNTMPDFQRYVEATAGSPIRPTFSVLGNTVQGIQDPFGAGKRTPIYSQMGAPAAAPGGSSSMAQDSSINLPQYMFAPPPAPSQAQTFNPDSWYTGAGAGTPATSPNGQTSVADMNAGLEKVKNMDQEWWTPGAFTPPTNLTYQPPATPPVTPAGPDQTMHTVAPSNALIPPSYMMGSLSPINTTYRNLTDYIAPSVIERAHGGIAALAAGGYPRRTGQIDGPGTATSDSIPAMLSDGEFVMTAKAVRGAGNGSRREGAKKMYALMHRLEKNAARG